MSYVVFARKFRPQNFEEVVGQDPIITTLKNAIRQQRIPQNFLFSGPRGTGKTSTARILAKSLNCEKGPTDNPCGKCPSCLEIAQSNSMDVLEIDGASNRGIDEIRNLRETVKFKPVSGRMKIYIIDEVHMLTTEAFNALLKTLEEPPPHVKFVFATTEPHKVPLTILSRCHRYNFKRISTVEIAKKLGEIASSEKLKHDKNALFLIAKASEGALRDAEGMLDQLASFSEGKIKEEDVLLMLGLAAEEVYFSTLEAIRAQDAKKVFSIVGELYEGGRDLIQFAKGLFEIFRHLLLLQCSNEVDEFIEMSDDAIAELKKRKDQFSRGELILGLSLLGNLQNQLRRNLAPPRLLVETVLLKLLHLDGLKSVEEMIEQVAAIPAKTGIQSHRSPTLSSPKSLIGDPDSGSLLKTSRDDKGSVIPAKAGIQSVDSPPSAVSLSLMQIESSWTKIIDYVKAKRMSTGIFLSESAPIELDEATVTLGLPQEFQFHKEMLEKDSNRNVIQEAFEVVVGKKLRVGFVITKLEAKALSKSAEGNAQHTPAQDESQLPDIISQALNIFDGAKIVRKD